MSASLPKIDFHPRYPRKKPIDASWQTHKSRSIWIVPHVAVILANREPSKRLLSHIVVPRWEMATAFVSF